MQGSKASLRYARAVLDLAKEQDVVLAVNEDMHVIGETINGNNELKEFLKSPVIKNKVKREALNEIFKNVNSVTTGLFRILIENNRADILAQVAKKFNALYDQDNNIQVARVTTAVPLTPALETKIQKKVKELTGNEAKINNIVDESIIGGFILRVGDLQYNASVKGQLSSLKREFQNNTYIQKI